MLILYDIIINCIILSKHEKNVSKQHRNFYHIQNGKICSENNMKAALCYHQSIIFDLIYQNFQILEECMAKISLEWACLPSISVIAGINKKPKASLS